MLCMYVRFRWYNIHRLRSRNQVSSRAGCLDLSRTFPHITRQIYSSFDSSPVSHSRSSSSGIRSLSHSRTASVPLATTCQRGTRKLFPATSKRRRGEPLPQFLLEPSVLKRPSFGGRTPISLFPTSRTCRPCTASKSRLLIRLSEANNVVRFG